MLFNYVATFAKVISSSVKGAKRSILFALEGAGTGFEGGEVEVSPEEPAYGQLGILARPLPARSSGPQAGAAEALCLRVADGLVPVAIRDLRISQAVPAPEDGQVMMAHYGGGYVTLRPADSSSSTTLVQIVTGPNEIQLDPSGAGKIRLMSSAVSVGSEVSAQSLAFLAPLQSYVNALKAYLTLVNPVVVTAAGPIAGPPITAAYGVLQAAETVLLNSASGTQVLKSN